MCTKDSIQYSAIIERPAGRFKRERGQTFEMALVRVGLGPVFLAPKRRFMLDC